MDDNDKAIAKPPSGRRALLLSLLIGLFLAAGIGYGIYWALVARYAETTDDAYVGGNLVQITPQVSGTVLAIGADDTDYVKAGQTLVELDQADSRVALDQAEAALARSVRQVRNLMATTGEIEANVAQRAAELARMRADLARRAPLAASGALPAEELQHARDAVMTTRASLDAAEQQLAAHKALVDRTTVETHPDVQSAAALCTSGWVSTVVRSTRALCAASCCSAASSDARVVITASRACCSSSAGSAPLAASGARRARSARMRASSAARCATFASISPVVAMRFLT